MRELIEFLNDEIEGCESTYDLSHDFLDSLKIRLNIIEAHPEVDIICKHSVDERIRTTQLWCCNICGKPIEKF